MIKWDYEVIKYDPESTSETERDLKDMGRNGWELVSVTLHTDEYGACLLCFLRSDCRLDQ